MTLIQIIYPNGITSMQVNKLCFAEDWALAPVFKKPATEPKPNLFRCKNINIATFNIRTLNTINHLPEHTASAAKLIINIICMQKHKYYPSELELRNNDSGEHLSQHLHGKNSVNATIKCVGILLSPHALKSLNSLQLGSQPLHKDYLLLQSH